MTLAELEKALPPYRPLDSSVLARSEWAGAPSLIVIDDDPTGTQTVHNVPVVLVWTPEVLRAELRARPPILYILTNSRSMEEAEAVAVTREVVGNVAAVAAELRLPITFCSRSDSTLRGHFPAETEAIAWALNRPVDAIILAPCFFAGGRYTAGDVHYLESEGELLPVAGSEFARDETFGYTESNLARWIGEKSGGRIRPDDIGSISLDAIRGGGLEAVAHRLASLPRGAIVIINALRREDLEVVVPVLLRAERAGRTFVYRTAASFVQVRAGIEQRSLLTREEIGLAQTAPGLVVVGSYVGRTNGQLARLLAQPGVRGIEARVEQFLDADPGEEIVRVARAADASLAAGLTPVVYTSRGYRPGSTQALVRGQRISAALVRIVRALRESPAFVVAKGGITSHVLAAHSLGLVSATVLGQVAPGVPVWKPRQQMRPPFVPYIVFPGNVGGPDTLAEVVARLAGPAAQKA